MASIKCTKLFKTHEEARTFMANHKEEHPRLTRADDQSKAILESTSTWKVTWYERPYHGEPTQDYWRNQKSCDPYYLAKAASLY